MKRKNSVRLMKIFSLVVIFSLILAACAPGDFLAGAGGADEAYPNPDATATTAPPATSAAATDTVVPTDTSEATATLVTSTVTVTAVGTSVVEPDLGLNVSCNNDLTARFKI